MVQVRPDQHEGRFLQVQTVQEAQAGGGGAGAGQQHAVTVSGAHRGTNDVPRLVPGEEVNGDEDVKGDEEVNGDEEVRN